MIMITIYDSTLMFCD